MFSVTPEPTLMIISSQTFNPLISLRSSSAWVLPTVLTRRDCARTVCGPDPSRQSWLARRPRTPSNWCNTAFGTALKGYDLTHILVSATAQTWLSFCMIRSIPALISSAGITAHLTRATMFCKCSWYMSSHAWVLSFPTPLQPFASPQLPG